jgi:hypothetical protein
MQINQSRPTCYEYSISQKYNFFVNIRAWVLVFNFFLLWVLNKKGISFKFSYGILVLSLIFSKFWFPINLWLDTPFFQSGHLYPWQSYFMHFGPCISWKMYCITLCYYGSRNYGLMDT